MKKLILLFLMLLSSNIFSQSGWEVIYPANSYYSQYFTDISFHNNQTGWVLSPYSLRKTTNAGQNWIKYDLAHSYNILKCFYFYNENLGWIVENNYVNLTSDGGTTWHVLDTTVVNARSVYFKDILTGWVCGNTGMIKKTTNGGYNWINIPSGTTNNLNAISFADDNIGACGGDWGLILWTTNGGVNWNSYTDIYLGFFTNVKYINSLTGFVGGTGGNIYRTTNSGLNWLPTYVNISFISSIKFNQSLTGYAFGSPGSFLNTTDYGNSWNQLAANGLVAQVNSASITQGNYIWAAADSGIIYNSTNLGVSWNEIYREYITKENLKSVYFINQLTGIAVGTHGVLLTTTNGGINWSSQNLGNENSLNSLQFVNGSTGYIGGGQGIFGLVLKSTNAGNNWQQVYRDSLQINSIHFINPSTGWGAGTNGVVIKTTDAGISWTRNVLSVSPYSSNNDIFFVNESTGFLGRGGIYKSTDGGQNWYRVSIYSTQSLQFIGNTGFATTSAPGSFSKTTNLGENWINYQTGGGGRGSLFFINTETGWINNGSTIRKTTNGGINWTAQNSQGQSIAVNFLFFNDEYHGWAVGDYGGIMRTTNGGIGITTISTEIPNGYNLFQNYPNPFNPTTKFKFQMPKSGNVKLTIYDITGKEVEVMLKEHLLAGTYEVDWNAAEYSSGVYFYSLTTNNFTQTRKMVVLK